MQIFFTAVLLEVESLRFSVCQGLEVIESTNLKYFTKEMTAEFYALKGMFLAQINKYVDRSAKLICLQPLLQWLPGVGMLRNYSPLAVQYKTVQTQGEGGICSASALAAVVVSESHRPSV